MLKGLKNDYTDDSCLKFCVVLPDVREIMLPDITAI